MHRTIVGRAVLLVILAACTSCQHPSQTSKEDLSYPVADFALTERDGSTVRRADLLGKVWVASFVFTRCNGPCPIVSATMARLQKEISASPDDFRLVTFTVDPEHDDPAVLRAYAETFRADPKRWLFLTGKESDVYRLLQDGFLVPVEKNAEGDPGAAVSHSTRLAVVDRRGFIRAYFSGAPDTEGQDPEKDFKDNLDRLKRKVADLLAEAPK
jgi:cytochrome oxidase Cu insertion factor (SCO1/SenC/PrrC family)